ncbi:hypothetical protein [Chitinophaga arvensicola]|uniref:Uncharacterized protein n=1 Tax=Chitinophaga arvensicola TaxID=29529 RepID=A0A1I0S9J2_9BACT|nr:hypothetical protein [Chitinophaga arvensicola]SEW52836.1 hypothetical protein SAMN04488122_5160 [Chitinophaga arvensicola]
MNNLLYRVFFSAITRMVLGIALLLTDPLSVTFRYLIVIIFLLPLIRYFVHERQQTEMDVFFTGYPKLGIISHVFITVGVAILYLLVLAHVLQIYTTSYFWWILMIITPVICWYLLFGKDATPTERHEHNRRALLRTVAFYLLPFFFAVNYAFDFSTPRSAKYYITRTDHNTYLSNDPDISETTVYYFYLLPTESITGITHWQKVPQSDYYSVRNFGRYNGKDSLHYLVMDKWKGRDSASLPFREQFKLLLLRTDTIPTRQSVPYRLYKRFKEGDSLNKEEHDGLFGIKWVSYH